MYRNSDAPVLIREECKSKLVEVDFWDQGIKNPRKERISKSTQKFNCNLKKKDTPTPQPDFSEEGISAFLKKKENERKAQNSKKKVLFDKQTKRHNNNLDSNLDRPKYVDKE